MKAHALDTRKVHLHIDGMKCAGCLAKIRMAAHNYKDLDAVDIDLSQKRLTAIAPKGFDEHQLVRSISSLGFQARIDSKPATNTKKPLNSEVLRLGIAGALAGNIMLSSAALYSGADNTEVGPLLNGLNAFLFVPVLTYVCLPFLKSAWHNLKAKKASVDTPIALAVLGGGLMSYLNYFKGQPDIYFDSIAMFAFFLLGSRYLISSWQSKFVRPISLTDVFNQEHTFKVTRHHAQMELKPTQLRQGDLVTIPDGQFVPCDGLLLTTQAEVDQSFITGESLPVLVKKFDSVFAGTRAVGSSIQIKSLGSANESRAARLVDKVNKHFSGNSHLTSFTDKGANLLTLAILSAALIYLVFHLSQPWTETWARLLALLVVACPCALAIAAPLAHRLCLRALVEKSILVKNPSFLETASQCENIVFDKTGTLTKGQLEVIEWLPSPPDQDIKNLIASLEQYSEHPIAKALLRALPEAQPFTLEVTEQPGVGVKAQHNGDLYTLKRTLNQTSLEIGLFRNGVCLIKAVLSDQAHEDANQLVAELKKKGKNIFLLSGDRTRITHSLADQVGILHANAVGDLSPEQKAHHVKMICATGKTLYVGDGINDSLAMKQADTSLSAKTSAELTFQTSQAHLMSPNPLTLLAALDWSKTCRKIVFNNIYASFAYNLTFGAFALLGWINPLGAVVLMPLSSLSLVGMTFYQVHRQGKSA